MKGEIDTDDLAGFCADALRHALNRGAEDAEVYAESLEQKKVSLTSHSMGSAQHLERRGMGIRVVSQKKTAFASVNAFAGHQLTSAIEDVIQLAFKSPYHSVLPDRSDLPEIDVYDPEMYSVHLEDVGEYAQHLMESVTSCDKRMHIESGMVLVTIHKRAIVTSKEIEAKEISSTAVWELLGAAREGTSVSDFDYQCEGTHYRKKIDVEGAAQRLTQAAIPSLRARSCNHFQGEVLLAPAAVASLVAGIGEAANASMVLKGVSALKDRLHTAVASPAVTLYDDALMSDGLASHSFDREGVAHCTLPVIEKGILTSFLHNTATASRAQCQSTGHATGGYRSRPDIGSTNLVIQGGDYSTDELLSDVRHGIVINRLSGAPDLLTGEFSFVVKNGVIITGGKRSEPVRGLIFSGNLYDIFNVVTGITKTVYPLGNGYYPYIRIGQQRLIG